MIIICECDGSCWRLGRCKSQEARDILKEEKKKKAKIDVHLVCEWCGKKDCRGGCTQ